MSNSLFPGDTYSPPTFIEDINSIHLTQPPVLHKSLPPPLPPKVNKAKPILPAKPKELIADIANMKSFPVIPNYESLSTEDAEIGKEEPCRIPYLVPELSFTVLPIPQVEYPVISQEEAITAFQNYVNSKCCWDHSYLSSFHVLSDEMCYCYKIILDTFFEARSACWREERLDDNLSSPAQGIAPSPWELSFPEDNAFQDQITRKHVPYTDIVKTCNQCVGEGRCICPTCKGCGTVPCNACSNTPAGESTCIYCRGEQVLSCGECQGLGNLTCLQCDGRGKMKQFIQVKSETRTHTLSAILARGGLIQEYVSLLEGKQIYCCRGRQLEEAECFYDAQVNNEIRRLLYESRSLEMEYEVICRQQQLTVSIIPIRVLKCQSGEHIYDLSVFDVDLKIFCPEYPVQKCGVWNNIKSSCSVM